MEVPGEEQDAEVIDPRQEFSAFAWRNNKGDGASDGEEG